MGCSRSPFLNLGTTLTVVQSVGIVPCFNKAWKNSANVCVSSSASVSESELILFYTCSGSTNKFTVQF